MKNKNSRGVLPLLAAMLLVCTMFFGCVSTGETASASSEMDFTFTNNELDAGYEEASATKITFNGAEASVSGSGASVGTGSVVTITEEGTYMVTGTASDGQLVVNAPDTHKVQIVLKGVTLTNADSAALYVQQADKVFITLAEGSKNLLADGKTRGTSEAESQLDGVIYSKADLAINGSGQLTVTGSYNHGIVSKDDLVITGGNISVTAEGQGLHGKDCVKIKDGTFTLKTGGDAIQSDNAEDAVRGFVYIAGGSFTIAAQEGDGIQAETTLRIDGGNFAIVTSGGSINAPAHQETDFGGGFGGGRGGAERVSGGAFNVSGGAFRVSGGAMAPSGAAIRTTKPAVEAPTTAAAVTATEEDTAASTKGLKAAGQLIINNGTFAVDTVDDGIHSNGAVTIKSGTITIATGDDGVHADDALLIDGGTITISKSYEGLEGKTITINGGDVDITSSDDGVNATDGSGSMGMGRPGENAAGGEPSEIYILMKGGTLKVDAQGDGLDSNGDLTLAGGTLTVYGTTAGGDSALDYDGTGIVTGGVLMGTGSSGMAQGFSTSSTQYSLLHSLDASVEAGSKVTISHSTGKTIASWTAEKQFNCVQYSSSALKEGETYTITAGSAEATVTMDSIAVSNGRSMGGMGGGMGGRPNNQEGMEPPTGKQPPTAAQ